ncbi:MAG: glycoside hydrolase family 3 C-terminal domain-containing protein [Spirochaetia bacterium]|jgi:beta-glucosidase|nr:glycoside hydrolase family 3 C-terminal domain-containing protein [Spirochaetia bacterium]
MRNRQWAETKAKALVAKMTIEEKASQLRYDAPQIERLGIPAYNWWNEGLHGVARAGVATVFPQAIALAAMFDDAMMEKIGDVIATEARAKYNQAIAQNDRDIYKGLTFWSPNINIFRDPRWGRGHETYGEDPYLASRLGCAFVNGLQGSGKYLKVAACAKHFAVHSGPEHLRHQFNAIASKKDLAETYLPAFEALVKDAEVEAVMGAYNRTNGEPCCANGPLMKTLRKEWGFKGHFVSDCWAIRDFHEHHKVTSTPEESVALALKSGCDVNCGCTYQYVLSALQKGLITEADIDRAATRLFTTRYLLGMFEKNEFDDISSDVIESKPHIDLALDAARKSCVLLKNDGTLPLEKDKLHTIGVIGPNANNRVALIGNYHGTSSRYITPLEGIQDEVDDSIRVLYSLGCPLFKKKDEGLAKDGDRMSEAISVAMRSDVVILCLGLDETLEGEEFDASNEVGSGDKQDLKLPGLQEELMKRIIETGKPVVVLLQAGSSLDLSYAKAHAAAILLAWYPGARGGKAIAEILFGKVSPSGKLPITFYKDSAKLRAFTDYAMEDRTYRYVNADNVLYPFGYGLTYGRAEVIQAHLLAEPTQNSDIEMEVMIRNASAIATEEVLEAYIQAIDSPYAVANQSLCQFKRISLEGKENRNIRFSIPNKAMQTVDENGKALVRGHRFILTVGFSQNDKVSRTLMKYPPKSINFTI